MKLFWGTLLACVGAVLAACSSGPEVAATFSSEGGAGPVSNGEGAASPGTSMSSASGASPDTSSDTSSGASSGASSSAASSSSSGQGSGGAGGGGGAGGCSFTSSDTCINAAELPSIHGDTGSDTRTVKGSTSAWFKVLVVEDSNFSNGLSYTASLVSPPGFLFQLFAYEGDSAVPNCLGEAHVAVGSPPSVSNAWNDNFGSDDDRWISFEVRYISGQVCDPAPEWTLTVQGHTQ